MAKRIKVLLKNKKGNSVLIILTFIFIVSFIFLFNLYIFFFQFNSQIINIRTDIFYICQNVLKGLDKYELGLGNYIIDLEKIKYEIEYLTNLNYKSSMDNKYIEITNIKYYMKGQRDEISGVILDYPTIHLEISVKVKPITLKTYIGEKTVKLHEDIKMSLMENRL